MKREALYAVLTICAVILTCAATYRLLVPVGRYSHALHARSGGMVSVIFDTSTGRGYQELIVGGQVVHGSFSVEEWAEDAAEREGADPQDGEDGP